VDACPTGASFKWEEDRIVDIDADKCVGCRAMHDGLPVQQPLLQHSPQHYYEQGPAYERSRTA
jgi:Fe-S-cluster-containing dehydrogenase component